MIVFKVSFLLLFFMSAKPGESTKPYVTSYIDQYKFLAIDEMMRTGIPASVTMAQAILESNAGASKLAKETNNHFGIKCKNYWEGHTYYHPDDDRDAANKLIPSCFRKYESVKASYLDHSNFLMNTPAYKPLFTFDKTEYAAWAEGLEICRYASDEQYAEKIIRTIELYDLNELDYYTVQFIDRSLIHNENIDMEFSNKD